MSLPINLMRTNVIADQDMQRVGMVFYLVMPQDTAPPSKPYIIDLLGYNSLTLTWTNFTGSVTIVDVDPQTHLSVGTPNTVNMNGSGETSVGSSITGVISVSVSSSAVKNSAVTLMALKFLGGTSVTFPTNPQYVLDSTTPLAANGVFTGQAVDTLQYGASYIVAEANSDQPGTLYIDFSEDNFNTVAFSAAFVTTSQTTSSSTNPFVSGTYPYNAQAHIALLARYVRVRYVNGTTAQTHFQLSHRFTQA